MADFDPRSEYPIGERRPDLVRTAGGFALSDLTIDRLRRGDIPEDEFRATAATLRMQADVARTAQRDQLAENLIRASELAGIPDQVILEIYTALRPHRSSADDLERWATRLETVYNAAVTAALVREAAHAYNARGLLA